jgi:general secretion pathway protein N
MASAKMIRYCFAFALALGLVLLAKDEPLFAAALSAIAPSMNAPTSVDTDITPETTTPPGTTRKEQPRGNPLWAVPLSSLTVTRERPIFSPSRRPPLPVVLPVSVAPPPLPQAPALPQRPPLELVGTVASDAEGIAVFIDQTTKATVKLKLNEQYTGWILQSVHGREVTLQKGEQIETLALPKRLAGPGMPMTYQDSDPSGGLDPSLLGKPLFIPAPRTNGAHD